MQEISSPFYSLSTSHFDKKPTIVNTTLPYFQEMYFYAHVYFSILSRVLVTNNAGSGLDERVYLLLIHTTSN
jgi:hypothetical protein